ncbi:MAG: N-acetylmuramoyl-L-alanine amidase [Bacteroidota bacterium]
MAKTAAAANRHTIWAFGRSYEFFVVTTDVALDADEFGAQERQKRQIVLHCTVGNRGAEDVITDWNNTAVRSSAHFIVERNCIGQAARPGAAGGDRQDNDGFVDAVRLVEENQRSFHGGVTNYFSIGIEICNVAYVWSANLAQVDGSDNEPSIQGNPPRPLDLNRWIHLSDADLNLTGLPAAKGGFDAHDYQAFEEEQYRTLLLLLRYLCIGHRIPRRFLGPGSVGAFRKYAHADQNTGAGRALRSQLYHYRGILHHRQIHVDKECPGILHRNRLFRGIIDEWWMPYDFNGRPRRYYSGPFAPVPYDAAAPAQFGANTPPSLFRRVIQRGDLGTEAHTYHDADIEALTATRSYYDLEDQVGYFSACETMQGGVYPVGTNKVWHGGIHFYPLAINPSVYAAASGTIVAARVSGHPDTTDHPEFGSQCFVLIRHYVHLEEEDDPDGFGRRINYTAEPTRVFSLYMHLEPIPEDRIGEEHHDNPPWFNLWRRTHDDGVGLDGEKGRVFNPDVEVCVGDFLGLAGSFREVPTLHFEVFTHQDVELEVGPWEDPATRIDDSDDQDVYCDIDALNDLLCDLLGDGIDETDVLVAAREMRNLKTRHFSEWAAENADAFQPVLPNETRRAEFWEHMERFTWVQEALAANPDLADQMGNGMFWYYHPIVFMQHVNDRILAENREMEEDEDTDVNVELDEDNMIVRFVDGQVDGLGQAQWQPAAADNERIQPYHINHGYRRHRFHFTREEIACNQLDDPPTNVRFSLSLLQALEQVRVYYNRSLVVALAHVSRAHRGQVDLCVVNTIEAMAAHHQGLAVDFHPSRRDRTPPRCQQLWNAVQAIVADFNGTAQGACGSPSQPDYPEGFSGLRAVTTAAAQQRFDRGEALTEAEAAAFVVHLELVAAQTQGQRVRVVFERLLVQDDMDRGVFKGAGEWTLAAQVNGEEVGRLETDVRTGDELPLEGWSRELDLAATDVLVLTADGEEADTWSTDSLGAAVLNFTGDADPPWGAGIQTLESPVGAYTLVVKIELL